MKTTIEIPELLFRRVKMQAVKDGLKMRDLIASALSAQLQQKQSKKAGNKLVKRFPFPIIKGREKWKMPPMTSKFLVDLKIFSHSLIFQ